MCKILLLFRWERVAGHCQGELELAYCCPCFYLPWWPSVSKMCGVFCFLCQENCNRILFMAVKGLQQPQKRSWTARLAQDNPFDTSFLAFLQPKNDAIDTLSSGWCVVYIRMN